MGVPERDPLSQLSLPPGFRFYPTDEELLVQYLCRKVAGHQFNLQIIGEIDLYKFDPWVLPNKAIFGEKEWYFFSPRDRKYPNGSRPNRVAGSGYWKATGTDKVITTEGRKVGIKKSLVFYIGKAPKGTKTNWIMHEYRLSEPSSQHRRIAGSGSSKLDEWVLCRIYKKNSSATKEAAAAVVANNAESLSPTRSSEEGAASEGPVEEGLEMFPELDDERFFALPGMDSLLASQPVDDKSTLQSILGSGNFEWSTLAGLNSVSEFSPAMGLKIRPDNNQVQMGSGMYVPATQIESQTQRYFNMESEQRLPKNEIISQQRMNNGTMNSGLYYPNTDYTAPSFPNSVDLFGMRYPNLSAGFGFRQ